MNRSKPFVPCQANCFINKESHEDSILFYPIELPDGVRNGDACCGMFCASGATRLYL